MNSSRCPICHGYESMSDTTFTVDLGFGVVVVRYVPIEIYEQCGLEWIDDETSASLEVIVNNAKKKNSIVDVSEFSALAS